MDWLGLVLAVVKLLGVFTQWLRMIGRCSMRGKLRRLPRIGDSIQCNWKALKAREDIRADAERNPGRCPDDDGFRRD